MGIFISDIVLVKLYFPTPPIKKSIPAECSQIQVNPKRPHKFLATEQKHKVLLLKVPVKAILNSVNVEFSYERFSRIA